MGGRASWLVGLGVLLVVGAAHASNPVTVTPSPINLGAVQINTSAMAFANANSTGSDTVGGFDLSGVACGEFSVPTLLPVSTPFMLTVVFTPTSPGMKSCQISLNDGTGNLLALVTASGTAIAPVASGLPSGTVDFGSVRATGNFNTFSFQLGNAGDPGTSLTVSTVTFSGANAGDFSVIAPSVIPFGIAAGTQKPVTIRFDPTGPGNRTATLTIATNDAAGSYSIPLTGIGTNGLIAVTDRDFGFIPAATSSTNQITLSNSAAAPVGPLVVTGGSLSGGAGWITFASNGGECSAMSCVFSGLTLPQNKAVNVVCAPPAGAAGTQTATASFTTDSDAGGDNMSVLTCSSGAPMIGVAPSTLAYGAVTVNTAHAMPLTITDTGTATLTYSLLVSGAQASMFTISGCTTSCNLAPAASAMPQVTFLPSVAGPAAASLVITSNDPTMPSLSIPMSGSGNAPQLVADDFVAFGTIEVGASSAPMTLTATNTGNATLTITSAAISGNPASYDLLSGTTGTQMVAPGASATWSLRCSPKAQGTQDGVFTIASNSVTGSMTTVGLTCTGTQGVLTATPSPYNFGGVRIGSGLIQTFTIRNTGNVAVSGIAASLAPTMKGYTISATPPAALAAGATGTMTVTFAPVVLTDGGNATLTVSGTWGATPTTTMATVAIQGTALDAGIGINPAALDFGALRWDTTLTRDICVSDTDATAVVIMSAAITPAAGTMSSELQIVGLKHGTCFVGSGTALPLTLTAMNDALVISVKVAPASRIGAISGDLVIMTNLPVNPTRHVPLTAMSTSPMLVVTPGMTLDFGPVDLAAGPMTRTLTITNNGDGPLGLASFTRNLGAAFTFVLPPDQTLTPGAHLDLPITYAPTAVGTNAIMLTVQLAGILNGPTMATFQITGSGASPMIDAPAALDFPDTFRNPGTAAPARKITIANKGEVTLHVTATTLVGSAFALTSEALPIAIAPHASHDFTVTFAPVAGGMFTGTLTLGADDPMAKEVVVHLTGTGLTRDVMAVPMVIDVGYVAVGAQVLRSGLIEVANNDPAATFRLRLSLDDASLFTVDDVDVQLAPASTQAFDVGFAPTEAGDFTAHVMVLLDDDPVPQTLIEVRGHAVAVEVHGGGCGAGRDTGAAAALLILLVLRRRRAALVLGLLLVARAAAADNLDIDPFKPAASTTGRGFQVMTAEVGDDGAWVASALASYATNPLVLDATGAGTQVATDHAIRHRAMLDLGGAYAFGGRFEAGLRLPIYSQAGDTLGDDAFHIAPAHGTALGDVIAHGKVRLAHGETYSVGACLQVSLPTATDGQFTGATGPSARLLALTTFAPTGGLVLTLDAGIVLRKHATFDDGARIEQGSGATAGVAASVRIVDELWATGELFGDVMMHASAMAPVSPFEALAGLDYRTGMFGIGIAVGRGLGDALGAPEIRGVLAVRVMQAAPTRRSRTRVEVVRVVAPPPPPPIDVPADHDTVTDVFVDTRATGPVAELPTDPLKAAEVTFQRGRDAMKVRDFARACAAFEQSQRLDPQSGTQFNLAGCYIELGKLATAWNLYREVARTDKNATRRGKANDAATVLAPRVPTLKLTLSTRIPGVQLALDNVDAGQFLDIDTPVDLGTYTLTASAPGYQTSRQTVRVLDEGKHVVVGVTLVPAR